MCLTHWRFCNVRCSVIQLLIIHPNLAGHQGTALGLLDGLLIKSILTNRSGTIYCIVEMHPCKLCSGTFRRQYIEGQDLERVHQ